MRLGVSYGFSFKLQDAMRRTQHDRLQARSARNLQWKFLPVVGLMFISLHGCIAPNQGTPGAPALETPLLVDDQRLMDPTTTPFQIASATALPERLMFGLPSRWLADAEAALVALPAGAIHGTVQLQAMEPTLAGLQSGLIDLALMPDLVGIPVAERALALAVPWDSEWDHISLEEAETILIAESPFVAAIEWPEVPPSLKPLRIDGLHPSQPEYPLRETWSLHARPGLEPLADTLARALSTQMETKLVHITAVGDIMLARGLGEAILTGADPYPFAAVQQLLGAADLTIGNLESALGDGGRAQAKGYTFLAPSESAEVLAQSGFDILSLANNHAMDYGAQTLLDAIDLLKTQGIAGVGAGADADQAYAPLLIEVGDIRVAFLAFVDVPVEVRGFDTRTWTATEMKAGVAWAEPEQIRSGIEAARAIADLVIIMLHSGYEYISAPSPPQQLAAHYAIDAGADLVIGHHAHVLQGVEFYGDGVIVYGLGNFAFEDGGVNDSGLMHIWLDPEGVRSLEFVPLVLRDDGRPMPADPARADTIRSNLYGLTRYVEP
jgi:poly-gamma-glutamate capsule biosynthesis protein CapA/YwtB (metallophosphatase superfamily)